METFILILIVALATSPGWLVIVGLFIMWCSGYNGHGNYSESMTTPSVARMDAYIAKREREDRLNALNESMDQVRKAYAEYDQKYK